MKHKRFEELRDIVKAGLPLHLIGESGCGKSTLVRQIAGDLGLKFNFIMCHRAVGEGKILGFNSVTTLDYCGTLFREAVEFGHMFAFEELTAIDPNTILLINSLDNGEVPFPDKIVKVHKNFRLVATSNPVNKDYGARTELDFSTINRFHNITLEKDEKLSEHLSSQEAKEEVALLRKTLVANNSSIILTSRDEMRLATLKRLNIKNPLMELISTESKELKETIQKEIQEFKKNLEKAHKKKQEKEEKALLDILKQERFYNLTQKDMTTFESFENKVKESK